ncbi:hypothetical protein [Streptococcus suis]|uniref:hypothetical protein n=2 Tax=Streptococcus suis TaxID=1307 RepID=UPI0037584D98
MRRAILLLLVMVLICLVEIILFYFLTGKLIKTFKLLDGKVNTFILWSYRLLFWDSIGLLVFGLVTSLSTGLDLWKMPKPYKTWMFRRLGRKFKPS